MSHIITVNFQSMCTTTSTFHLDNYLHSSMLTLHLHPRNHVEEASLLKV